MDYYQKSVQALIETYPDLMGLSISAGENMSWLNEDDVVYAENKWLHDVYKPGINVALEKEPDRYFRLSVSPVVKDLYEDCLAEICFGANYTGVHMYASSEPHNADNLFANLPEGYRCMMLFRNEDIFDMRWGDPDFMRTFVKNMPDQTKIYGFVTGSDGYCLGRDYSSTDPDLQGILYIKKHWFNYMLISRLSFQPDLPDKRLYEIFDDYYENRKGTDVLYEATSRLEDRSSSEPDLLSDNSDYTWFVSGCWSHPNTNGYLDILRWMRGSNAFPRKRHSYENYALDIVEGVEISPDKETPYTASRSCRSWQEMSLKKLRRLGRGKSVEEDGNSGKNFWLQVEDNEAMAYLGLYYSEKMVAAIELGFSMSLRMNPQESCITHLELAENYFTEYAALISKNYVPQHMARVGSFDINFILEEVKKDIDKAKSWKPRKLGRSFNPPSKTEYYSE